MSEGIFKLSSLSLFLVSLLIFIFNYFVAIFVLCILDVYNRLEKL